MCIRDSFNCASSREDRWIIPSDKYILESIQPDGTVSKSKNLYFLIMFLNSGEKDLTKKLNCFFEIINVLARAAVEINK